MFQLATLLMLLLTHASAAPPPEMMRAAASGDIEAMEKELAAGGSVDVQGENKLTPLIMAAYSGNMASLEWLLEHGADPNLKNADGETALVSGMAPANADYVIAALLGAGANPNIADSSQRTPLAWAAAQGHVGAAKALLKAGADPTAKDAGDGTAMTLAILTNNPKMVDALLEAPISQDLGPDAMIALSNGQPAMVLKLVDAGLSVEYTQGERNLSLMHMVAIFGDGDLVAALLKRGAKPDPVDIEDTAPLGLAAYSGNLSTVEALLAGGAKVDHVTVMKGSALRAAADQGKIECVKALLAAGASPRLKDQWGKTPAYYAKQNGHPEVVSLLEGK